MIKLYLWESFIKYWNRTTQRDLEGAIVNAGVATWVMLKCMQFCSEVSTLLISEYKFSITIFPHFPTKLQNGLKNKNAKLNNKHYLYVIKSIWYVWLCFNVLETFSTIDFVIYLSRILIDWSYVLFNNVSVATSLTTETRLNKSGFQNLFDFFTTVVSYYWPSDTRPIFMLQWFVDYAGDTSLFCSTQLEIS